MEAIEIEEFVFNCSSPGDGSGYYPGDGSGFGDSEGYGSGYGIGSIYKEDSGFGDGDSEGYGSGDNDGIKSFNGKKVYVIDGVQTIIKSVRGNVAKGFILQNDLTLTPCFIVKENNVFAHGNTLHKAFEALQDKLYDESTEEERISKFKENFKDFSKKYSASDLFVWHHILTGSCKAGREAFCRDHSIDVNKDLFTVYEFIELTKNAYKGEIINKLIQ